MVRQGKVQFVVQQDGANLAELLRLIGDATVRKMAWYVDLIDYGDPVKRERQAKDDLKQWLGVPVQFTPYN